MTALQRYEVIDRRPGFEVRSYEPYVIAEMSASGAGRCAGTWRICGRR